MPVATRRRTRLNMNKIAECRERSQSAWLHFPHVELVFLLFAFEGAVAAQVAAVRENASPVVFVLAIAALVRLLGGVAGSVLPPAFERAKFGVHLANRAAHRWFRVGCYTYFFATPSPALFFPTLQGSAPGYVTNPCVHVESNRQHLGIFCPPATQTSFAISSYISHACFLSRFSTRYS